MIRTTLLGTAALFAVAVAAPTFAQTAAPAATAAADDESLEIVVTAQKRSEKLQDVPVAVTVVTGETLARQGAVTLEGAQYLVPSLNFRKSGTTLNQTLYLRGVGTATFSIAGEPSVSTVLDGVVLSRSGEAFTDLVDIAQLEVLRGPQGTLFGKNSSAGVISITSKRPGDTLAGFVDGGFYFGNGNEYRVRGGIDIPMSDVVKSRFTGFYGKYDGNIFNDAPGVNRRVNGYEHYGVRGIVEATPTDKLKLTLIGDWRQGNDDCCAEVIGTAPTGVGSLALAGINFQGDKTRTIRQNLITQTRETAWGLSLQADLELGSATLTSITAYRDWKNTEIRDGDFVGGAYVGLNQLHDNGPQIGHTFTQEIRLASAADQFFSYVVGAFYSNAYSERTFIRSDVFCGTAAPAPLALISCGSPGAPATTTPSGSANFGSRFQNIAVFGQGTLNFSDRFRGIVGLRYTYDILDVFHRRVSTGLPLNGFGVPSAIGGINPNFDQGVQNSSIALPPNGTPLASDGVPFRTGTSTANLSGKAGLQFDINDDVMTYATYSRGYKGPAYNIFFNLNPNGTNVIEAETADSYEIGLKNSLFDGKLILNIAAYYAKYKNFQANNQEIIANVPVSRFTNAGDVSTRGAEVDFLIRPVRDLNIAGGVAYTDARVDQFKVPPVTPGVTPPVIIPPGTPLAYAPKWKGSLGIDYRVRTNGFADVTLAVQGSTQSSQLSLFVDSAALRTAGVIGAYSIVDVNVGIIEKDDRWKLNFVVKNLFDKSFAAAITNGGPGGSFRYLISREADRYFGVTGRVNF